MTILGRPLLTICLCLVILQTTHAGTAVRNRRSVANMARQIGYHFSWIRAGELRDYGCWCGTGGSGTPVDGIDTCCMNHDHCYDQNGCSLIHVNDYSYEWTTSSIRCTDSTESCDYANCECDRVFLECLRSAGVLRRYLPGYHSYRGPC